MTQHNQASDANLANAEWELLLQKRAEEKYAAELTTERLHALAASTGPLSLEQAEFSDRGRDLEHYPRGWWLPWLVGSAILVLVGITLGLIVIAQVIR